MDRKEAEEVLLKRNIFGKGELSKMDDKTVVEAALQFTMWLENYGGGK